MGFNLLGGDRDTTETTNNTYDQADKSEIDASLDKSRLENSTAIGRLGNNAQIRTTDHGAVEGALALSKTAITENANNYHGTLTAFTDSASNLLSATKDITSKNLDINAGIARESLYSSGNFLDSGLSFLKNVSGTVLQAGQDATKGALKFAADSTVTESGKLNEKLITYGALAIVAMTIALVMSRK